MGGPQAATRARRGQAPQTAGNSDQQGRRGRASEYDWSWQDGLVEKWLITEYGEWE